MGQMFYSAAILQWSSGVNWFIHQWLDGPADRKSKPDTWKVCNEKYFIDQCSRFLSLINYWLNNDLLNVPAQAASVLVGGINIGERLIGGKRVC